MEYKAVAGFRGLLDTLGNPYRSKGAKTVIHPERLRISAVLRLLRASGKRLRTMMARPRVPAVAERLRTKAVRRRPFPGYRYVPAVLERARGSAGRVGTLAERTRTAARLGRLRAGAERFEALVERSRAARPPRNARQAVGVLGVVTLGAATLAIAWWWSFERQSGGAPDRLYIESGETVASLFARAGLSDEDLLAVMEAGRGAAFAIPLVPGEEVRITRGGDGRLRRLFLGRGEGEATAFVIGEGGRWFMLEEHASPSSPEGTRPAKAEEDEPPARSLAGGLEKRAETAVHAERRAPRDTPSGTSEPAHPEVAASRPQAGANAVPSSEPPEEPLERTEVRPGDSLSRIFERNGLPQADLAALLSNSENEKKLKRVRPGQSIAFQRGQDGRLIRFDFELDELTTLRFVRDEPGFTAETIARDYDRHIAGKNGIIKSSLFAAAAGVPDPVIMQLVSVLDWDIDFDRDVRRGDSFSILYEELRVDDRLIRAGDILALEFQSKRAKDPIRAFRYTDTNGNTDYFAPDGRSLRRAFMRNPIRFKRISSRFSNRRLHPVYKTVRPHRGVDYAAPTGTPIRAAGDGRVTWAGRKGGYGKTVILSHGNGYSTLYAHLSRYEKGTKKGAWIRQGAVIGRVGSTGVSTGPHLHYEFRIDGVHKDPLTVKLPRADPLDEAELKRFQDTVAPLAVRLDTLGATRLASLGH